MISNFLKIFLRVSVLREHSPVAVAMCSPRLTQWYQSRPLLFRLRVTVRLSDKHSMLITLFSRIRNVFSPFCEVRAW